MQREHVFDELLLVRDPDFHAAALNMAVDEALLETVTVPVLRVYRWDHPAVSFGYSGRFNDVANHSDRDLVRRWTGGGIVFHGADLTYGLIIPAGHAFFAESSNAIYEETHRAIRNALFNHGIAAQLATVAAISDRRNRSDPAVGDRRYKDQCFANPVRADVMLNEQKVAGAAQRRTRLGLLQQGSIQNVELDPDFSMRFAAQLASHYSEQSLGREVLRRGVEIANEKYATSEWLRKR